MEVLERREFHLSNAHNKQIMSRARAHWDVIQLNGDIYRMEITAKKISKKSLFKLLAIGFTFGVSIFAILCGIAALFGAETVEWNGVYRTGVEGLFYSFLIGPVAGFFSACFIWFFTVLGLWLYSFFKPIKVQFKEPIGQE
ncbi:hypothetical protein [Alteromonas sp. V450]|uniref:hypothetical protein n=1 Tax=Alteromonas sp. V450 TaxID=1912139 RepID=UPI001C42EE8C|nr:hypothetical protein [Alteromonas sp. V450]